MREIKFRIYDFVDKEITLFEKIRLLPDETMVYQLFEEERYHWMQYTGLKDKNGKEIYEGDILDGKLEVSFKDGMFGFFSPTHFIGLNLLPINFREVIGNIYENPELL